MGNRKVVIIVFYPRLSPRQELIARALKKAGFSIAVLAWDRTGERSDTPETCLYIDEWRWVHVPAPLGKARVVLTLAAYYRQLIKLIRAFEKETVWILTHFFLLPVQFFCSGVRIYDAAELFALDLTRYLPLPRVFARKMVAFCEGMLERPLGGVLTTDSKGEWLETFYRRWNSHVQVLWNVPSREDEPPE